jgi:hypothetical protein
MPKALSNITLLHLNNLLLEISQNRVHHGQGFITTQKLDEICELGGKRKQETINKARARYIEKLRELHQADLEYDRANKRYVLKNSAAFVVNLNLSLQVTPGMLAAFSAGNVFVQKFLPHLSGSSSALQTELERLFGKPLFSEGRSLASSVTMSLPTARIDGAVFSLVQQAIREKKTISFSYTSPNPEAAQKAKKRSSYSPWRLYFTDRSWYVWGSFKNSPNGIPYKICRMKDLTLGGEQEYSPPPKGQEPDKILRSVWSARPGTAQHDVELSFLPPLAASIEETEWPDSVSISKGKKDGEILLSTKVADLQGVAFFVLAGAPCAFANEPEDLRNLVVELSEKQMETQNEIIVDKYIESQFSKEAPEEYPLEEHELDFLQMPNFEEMFAEMLSSEVDDPFPDSEYERE